MIHSSLRLAANIHHETELIDGTKSNNLDKKNYHSTCKKMMLSKTKIIDWNGGWLSSMVNGAKFEMKLE